MNNDLWMRVRKCADAAGYSSPEEFVEHVLERELAKTENSESDEEIMRKLQSLGYID